MTYPGKICDVPRLAPGSVLRLGADDWLYGRGVQAGQSADLVVERVRDDLVHLSGGEDVWVEGHAVGCAPGHRPCRELLVRMAALRNVDVSDAP